MSLDNQDGPLQPVRTNNDWWVRFTQGPLETGFVATDAWLTLELTVPTAAGSAPLRLHITTTPGTAGAIQDDGTVTGSLIIFFKATKAQTAALTVGQTYNAFVEIQVTNSSVTGNFTTFAGQVPVFSRVTT